MARSRTRSSRRVALAATAALAFSPAACTDSSESAPASTSPTTSETRPAPPTDDFQRLSRHAAQVMACMFASEKTEAVADGDDKLLSLPGEPAALLVAERNPSFMDGAGSWQSHWSEFPFSRRDGDFVSLSVRAFVPPESTYRQTPGLTIEGVQVGADDLQAYQASVTIASPKTGPVHHEMLYAGSSVEKRDPKTLSSLQPDSSWRQTTSEDMQEFSRTVEEAIGTLTTKSQITDCTVKP